MCLQRDSYMPSTYEQDKLAQLTDLIDTFTRKVRPLEANLDVWEQRLWGP